MKEVRIFGILVPDRNKDASLVQNILTKYGCSIKTRLGLHEMNNEDCCNYGLILLEMLGESTEWDSLEKALMQIEGIQVQKITFDY